MRTLRSALQDALRDTLVHILAKVEVIDDQ